MEISYEPKKDFFSHEKLSFLIAILTFALLPGLFLKTDQFFEFLVKKHHLLENSTVGDYSYGLALAK